MERKLGCYVILKNAATSIEALLRSIEGVFDEMVIVDTGSTDDTRERVRAFYGASCWDSEGPVPKVQRLVLASFEWVDDFSAARQFAFELGTAKWRTYLDGDDTFEDGAKLAPMLERTEREHPEANIISLKYAYCDDELPQDVLRLVRWADGWRWEDELHEHMVPVDHPRVISKYEDVWVRHHKTQEESNAAFDRNVRISEKVIQDPNTPPDKRARFSYFLGDYAAEVGDLDLMREYYAQAADGLGRCNLGCHTLVRWARMELKHGGSEGVDKAITLAGRAITAAPELPDGWAVLGIGFVLAGQPYRAASVFDQLWAQPKPAMESMHDAVFLDGLTRAYAAKAYYQAGRIDDAAKMTAVIPMSIANHPEVRAARTPILTVLLKHEGVKRLTALWEYLIWDTEPLKARELLERFAPAAVSDSPAIGALKRRTEAKLPHMQGWEGYKRAYAAIPDLPFHVPEADRAATLVQGRARGLAAWARSLPKEGPPVDVLAIGVQDGLIEALMLASCPRIALWVCDVAPQASKGIQELQAQFPGRVQTHAVVKDHYDWFPAGKVFDAVTLFEVLEHLPNDAEALALIREHLKSTGTLFLSTPIAEVWVEPYLSEPTPRPWWHVRAHNPTSLWHLLQRVGFTGSLAGVAIEGLFFVAVSPCPVASGPEITIYIPSWAPRFDPFSAKEGHLGGSEEAVLHLAPALVRLGARVTVYVGQMPARRDQVFVSKGVQWRTHAELDVKGLTGTVLVWRAPGEAAMLKHQNPRLRILAWMHDTSGYAGPVQYEAIDGTIVLSEFHAEAIEVSDGYAGPFLMGANGIDPTEFPEPDEAKRDPHLAVYASAPNRGLDMLLACWPRIRAQVLDAQLRIFYGWELTEKMMKNNAKLQADLGPLLASHRQKFEELKDQGVEYVGGVSHEVLHREFRSAGVLAYPCYGEAVGEFTHPFHETWCITIPKVQASGCWPVVMDTGAIPEVTFDGAIVPSNDVDAFVAATVKQMHDPGTAEDRAAMRESALERFSWAKTAKKFLTHAEAKNERITIFCGVTFKEFDGCSLDEQLGGSEEAVVLLARELARRGREVFVYTKLPAGGARDDGTSIRWRNDSEFVPEAAHGTVLAWRCPQLVPQLKGNGYPVILWLMDPSYEAPASDFDAADAVVFLTKAHQEIIRKSNGYIGGGAVVPICIPAFPVTPPHPRDPHSIMWATSPDRGLLEFLALWPKVKAAVPDATLHIYYGLESLHRAGKSALADAIEEKVSKLRDVTYPAGVSLHYLTLAYRACGVFAYRSLGFEETQSLATIKAAALGCWPVVNATGALPEVLEGVGTVVAEDEDFVKRLVQVLLDPPDDEQRAEMADIICERFSAKRMGDQMLAAIAMVNP